MGNLRTTSSLAASQTAQPLGQSSTSTGLCWSPRTLPSQLLGQAWGQSNVSGNSLFIRSRSSVFLFGTSLGRADLLGLGQVLGECWREMMGRWVAELVMRVS